MRTGIALQGLVLAGCSLITGCILITCRTVDIAVPLAGRIENAALVSKNYEVIDTVTVSSTETRSASPLGLVRRVEGSKITFSDLILAAASLDADDIIDIRIDMNISARTGPLDWLKGWERTFTYTGQAIAIRYVSESTGSETNEAEKMVAEDVFYPEDMVAEDVFYP